MQFRLTVLFLAAAVTGLVAQSAPPRITPVQARDFRGKVVTLCGRIAGTGCKRPDGVLFNFPWHPDGTPKIRLSQAARDAAEARLEDRFLLQGVCATGTVQKGKWGDEIVVDDPSRITVEERFPVPPFAPHAHWPCEPDVVEAVVTKQVQPVYPLDAARRRIRGVLVMQTVVEANGAVGPIQLLVTVNPDLDQAAVDMLRQWKFKPGKFKGQPAPVIFTVQVDFGG